MSDADRDGNPSQEPGDRSASERSGAALPFTSVPEYSDIDEAREGGTSPRWLVTRVIVVVIVGLLVTASVVGLAISAEEQQRASSLSNEVEETKRQIEQRIAELDNVLLGLRGSVVSNPDFNAEAFHKAVNGSSALDNVAPVRAVQWAVTVPLDGGKAFEKQA